MRTALRAIVFFSLFFVQTSWAGVRVLCDSPATPLSRYTVNLVQNKLVRLAYQADQRLVDLALSKPNLADDFEMEGMTELVNYVRDTPFMRQGAWDFLHNRVFKEMDAIQALCRE